MLTKVIITCVPIALALPDVKPSTNPRLATEIMQQDCGCALQGWSSGSFSNGYSIDITEFGASAGVEITFGKSVQLSEDRCNSECVPSGQGCGLIAKFNITDFGSLPGGKICVPLASPAFFPLCTTSSVGSLYECCRSGQDTVGLEWHLETGCGGSLSGNAQLSAEIDGNGFQPLVASVAFGFDCTPCVVTPN